VRAEVDPATGASPSRPRIGLVLGGGGAKGAAHVGVLRVLDEMRIPIDCIAGTSMGALVGGTYAAGTSAVELEQAVRTISWKNAIAFEGKRVKDPMRRKLSGVSYSNSLEFGFRDGGLMAPASLIGSQNIDQTIQYLVARSQGVTDFDRLPIQSRAVATDMQKGEMAVLDQGSLPRAACAACADAVIAGVRVEGAVRVNPDYVREALRLEAGDVVTPKTIERHVNDVCALGDFDMVRYALSGPVEAPTLEVMVAEKANGPNEVRFDIGLYMGTDTSTAFTLGGDFLRTWINSRGACSAPMPTSGLLARVAWFESADWFGAAADYQRLEGMVSYALPVGSSVAYLRAAGGSSLGSALPAYDQFLLGGPLTLTLAGTSEGDWQIMFDLGRPIQEHTIMDPVR